MRFHHYQIVLDFPKIKEYRSVKNEQTPKRNEPIPKKNDQSLQPAKSAAKLEDIDNNEIGTQNNETGI